MSGAQNVHITEFHPLFAWIMRDFPSIELRGDNLTCIQNGEFTNMDDQNALLNLLCDLAEKMGSESASSRRN